MEMSENKTALTHMVQASGVAPSQVDEALASFEITVAKEAAQSGEHMIILEEDFSLPVVADSLEVGSAMTGKQLNLMIGNLKGYISGNKRRPISAELGSFFLDDKQRLSFRIEAGAR